MANSQQSAAIAIDQFLPTERIGQNFRRPEEIAEVIDLDIIHKPVLMPREIFPNRAVSKLQNGKYAIYDVGFSSYRQSEHLWNVEPDELKIHMARFRLQQDSIYQDLVMGVGEKEDAPHFFRHWTGAPIIGIMPWEFRRRIVPLYFPKGVFIPSQTNPVGQNVIKNYVFADGTIEVNCRC